MFIMVVVDNLRAKIAIEPKIPPPPISGGHTTHIRTEKRYLHQDGVELNQKLIGNIV